VFHPDKHIDQSKHSQAQEAFGRIQEAYEVLSNPHKRQIYDVYGRKGLAAGLEVGDALRSREELRREWEEFRGREAREKAEAAVVQRGSYQAKVDLRPALAGKGLPGVTHPGTLFKSVSAQ
ncbi:J domain-containing protein, partial [Haematococcus lacustris]